MVVNPTEIARRIEGAKQTLSSQRRPADNISKLVAADVSPLQSHAKPGKSEPTHVGCYDKRMF